MKRRFAPGFTLIEILVVIGIIALLAAILFPVFTSVREKGRSAVCQSNLKQIHAALTMYMGDYDQKFPHALDPADKFAPIWDNNTVIGSYVLGDIPLLTDIMTPYVKGANVWKCPSDSGFSMPDSITWKLQDKDTFPSCFGEYQTSYFYRTELMFKNLTDERLTRPTEVNVFMDAHGSWHGRGRWAFGDQRRYNVLFADGHVKSVDGKSFDAAWDVDIP